ncbi:IclR family transcriptional regulator [Tenacibaculum sp. C7A-26P2]|uniref:IclR family transcriptional regulator n=1 Tax=Tenacibaculum sp. C7A-26P2 TaxID=3447504 RepID=UPI003F82413D
MESTDNDKKLNLSIIKAFELLNAFTVEKNTWGVRELAQKTGYNKSTVYRILNTLSVLNVIHQNSNDKYSLGSKLFELGNRVSIYKSIRKLSNDSIKKTALEIQETVLLSIIKDNQVFHINKADSLHGLKMNTSIGAYQPIYATASGKLLFSFLDEDEKENIINNTDLKKYTKNTITSRNELLKELEKIKNQGFALDIEELEPGLICIAIPVKNKNGNIIASLSASGPLSRFRMKNITKYIGILNKEIKNIEKAFYDFENLS